MLNIFMQIRLRSQKTYHDIEMCASDKPQSPQPTRGVYRQWRSCVGMLYEACIKDSNIIKPWSCYVYGGDIRFEHSQWKTSVQSNDVCHWLGVSLESALDHVWDIDGHQIPLFHDSDFCGYMNCCNIKHASLWYQYIPWTRFWFNN